MNNFFDLIKQTVEDMSLFEKLIVAIAAIAIICAVFLALTPQGKDSVKISAFDERSEIFKSEESDNVSSQNTDQLVVYISGRVVNPGIYSMKSGDRLADLVSRAGDLTEDANIEGLNMAELLIDGNSYYIPENAGSFEGNSQIPTQAGGKVNINRASLAEIETLPGIGPVLAQRIIDYRNDNGPFRSMEDVKKVRGIGTSKADDIKDLITF